MMDTTAAIRAFVADARKRTYAPKQMVEHAGEASRSVCLILEGSFSVTLGDGKGHEVVLAYLNPGDFCGTLGLFPEADLDGAAVRTRSPALVAEMSHGAFRCFAERHPEIMFAISRQLARCLRDSSQRFADVAFLDVAGRLANALRDLTRKPDAVPHPHGTVVRISRMELARHVGCSREMAGRALKKLSGEGLILDQGRNILVYEESQEPALSFAA